ncbi:EpsG family protein [Candidatus Saccharibacteria bacterium]|nr:EpsG family protein [Candidatus Saccharibacteria bacterium]
MKNQLAIDDNRNTNKTKEKGFSLFLVFINIILTILFPILSIPVSIVFMIINKGKARKWHGLLFALSMAILAYIWEPGESMDLYRHHQQLSILSGGNTNQLWLYITHSLEPIHYLIKYFVAQIGNYDLLQFLLVFIGYAEITWLICDLSEVKMVSRKIFTILLLYAVLGLNFIGFASGLWFYAATINTVLGIYLYYFRKTKYCHYLFFIIAPLLHMGTIYMILAMIAFSIFPFFKKIRIHRLIIVATIAFLFGTITTIVSKIFGTDSIVATLLNGKFTEYFVNGSQFDYLHTGWNLYLPIANTVLSMILAIWHSKKYESDNNYFSSFVAYMAVFIFATILNAGVFVRYGFFIIMMNLPLIADYLQYSKNKKRILLLLTTIAILTGTRGYFSLRQIDSAGLYNRITLNTTRTTIELLEKKYEE